MADYYAGGSDLRRQFEGAIPILIIILLVVGVIALKPSILAGVPVLGGLVGAETIDVLLIGENQNEKNAWENHLTTDLARQTFGNPLNVELVTDNEYNKINSEDWIKDKGYDLVIVTATDLTPSLQITLKNWVNSGENMMVVGLGGTQSDGRWSELSTVLPVTCGSGTSNCEGVVEEIYAPTMHIESGRYDNKLAKKLNLETDMTPANASINLADVTLTENGKQIVYVDGFSSAEDVQAGEVGDIYPAISEKGDMSTGKVLYLTFNPVRENLNAQIEENLLLNTVAYITGAEGSKG